MVRSAGAYVVWRVSMFADVQYCATAPEDGSVHLCVQNSVWWILRADRSLLPSEPSRFVGSSKMVSGVNDVSINVLELLGMVVGAEILITQQQFVPQEMGDCIQLGGDNESSVAWIQRCRGGKEPRSGDIFGPVLSCGCWV